MHRIRGKDILSALTLTVAVAAVGSAQQDAGWPDFETLDANLRFKIAADGVVQIAPDPSMGRNDAGFCPIVPLDPGEFLANAGPATFLAALCLGPRDLASMADAQQILKRLGCEDGPALFEVLRGEGFEQVEDQHARNLLRLLAVRATELLDLKAAVRILEEQVAKDPKADELLKDAATRAALHLRGKPAPPIAKPESPHFTPIGEFLAHAPPGTNVVLRVDHSRLPSAHNLLRWARIGSLERTKQIINAAGGTISLATWASGVKLSEAPAVAPYDFARRFGNARLHELHLALRFELELGITASAHQALVTLDPDRITRALEKALGTEAVRADGVARLEPSDHEGALEISRHAIRDARDAETPSLDADAAQQLATRIDQDDAPIVVVMDDGMDIAFMGGIANAVGAPRRIGIWLPTAGSSDLRLSSTWGSDVAAQALATLLRSAPKSARAYFGHSQAAEALEPALAALDAIEVKVDGPHVTARISCEKIDTEKLVLALIPEM